MAEPNLNAEEIFHAARALAAGAERSAFLDRACGGEADLRAEVEGLLRADAEAGSFLAREGGAPDSTPHPVAPADRSDEAPHPVIGRYKILQQIGEGGFGLVYLAEQTEPVIRRVALKIIKHGMDSRQVIARFEAERQALALMDHPNIARVLDAGETPDGRPYFVMELVHGEPITSWCDAQSLNLDERLDLFVQVCQAVQHAHQKGVIHRDLKPSNVLVTVADDRPVPKVIDFGIAKATRLRLTEKTLFTEMRQLIGTPEYMSPEQADAGGVDVDTRSDVYSLGVLLYELLTGSTPFDPKRLRSAAFGEIQRIIREEEPPKPSTRLSTLESLPTVAAHRRAEPRRLGTLIRGDLDWIVMRCLEKDRRRRYETAEALVMDVRRHLRHEPVLAGPPGAAYRLRKFMRRHRAAVIAGSALAASLMLGIVGTSVGLSWALREKARARTNEQTALEEADRAEREAARALAAKTEATRRADELERVAAFQASQLANIDAATMGVRLRRDLLERKREALSALKRDDPEIEAGLAELESALAGVNFTDAALSTLEANIFDRALTAIEEQFADQPLLKARLLHTLAGTMRDLGLLERALAPQMEALEIRRRLLGNEDRATLSSLSDLGTLHQAHGRFDEAEAYYREALEAQRGVLGHDDLDTLVSEANLGAWLHARGRLEEAESHLRAAVEGFRRIDRHSDPQSLTTQTNLARLLHAQSRFVEAERLAREVMAAWQNRVGPTHPRTLTAMNTLAALLLDLGRLDEAERLWREALAAARETLGDEHYETLVLVNNMGALLREQSRFAQAEPYYRSASQTLERVLGREHPTTLTSLSNLGLLLHSLGRLDESEPLMREVLEAQRRVLGSDHEDTLRSMNNIAGILRAQGQSEQAEPLLREAMETMRRKYGDAHPGTLALTVNTCMAWTDLARFDESERTLLAAVEVVERHYQSGHPFLNRVAEALVYLYDARHKAAPGEGYDLKAAEWRRRAGAAAPSP